MAINGRVVTLKDTQNKYIFPETTVDAVYTSDGSTIEEKISKMITIDKPSHEIELEKPEMVKKVNNIESNISELSSELETITNGICYGEKYGLISSNSINQYDKLNEIINYCTSNNISSLVLPSGVILIDRKIILPHGLRIKSESNTIIKATKEFKDDTLVSFRTNKVVDERYILKHTIENITLDGNLQNIRLLDIRSVSTEYEICNKTFSNVYFKNTYGTAIYLGEYAWQLTFINCGSQYCVNAVHVDYPFKGANCGAGLRFNSCNFGGCEKAFYINNFQGFVYLDGTLVDYSRVLFHIENGHVFVNNTSIENFKGQPYEDEYCIYLEQDKSKSEELYWELLDNKPFLLFTNTTLVQTDLTQTEREPTKTKAYCYAGEDCNISFNNCFMKGLNWVGKYFKHGEGKVKFTNIPQFDCLDYGKEYFTQKEFLIDENTNCVDYLKLDKTVENSYQLYNNNLFFTRTLNSDDEYIIDNSNLQGCSFIVDEKGKITVSKSSEAGEDWKVFNITVPLNGTESYILVDYELLTPESQVGVSYSFLPSTFKRVINEKIIINSAFPDYFDMRNEYSKFNFIEKSSQPQKQYIKLNNIPSWGNLFAFQLWLKEADREYIITNLTIQKF